MADGAAKKKEFGDMDERQRSVAGLELSEDSNKTAESSLAELKKIHNTSVVLLEGSEGRLHELDRKERKYWHILGVALGAIIGVLIFIAVKIGHS